MKDILFNSVGKVRSGWRFIIFLLLFLTLYIFIGFFAFSLIQVTTDNAAGFLAGTKGLILNSVIGLFAATILGWLCGKILEGLPIKTLGWVFNRTWLKDFFIGLILGALTLSFAVLITLPTQSISLVFNQTDSSGLILQSFIYSFLIFFIAAAFEEVLFRGYILQTFLRSDLAIFGIIVTSFLFGFVHNSNPSANYLSFVNTVLAGIWFALAYLKTRSLWLVFGLHLGWNWIQGAFFGINVSGLSEIAPNPLFRATEQGADWFTGGSYGVEAGIICTIALCVSTTVVWYFPTLRPTAEMLELTEAVKTKESVS